jgi:hypothetical protein
MVSAQKWASFFLCGVSVDSTSWLGWVFRGDILVMVISVYLPSELYCICCPCRRGRAASSSLTSGCFGRSNHHPSMHKTCSQKFSI